MPRSGSLTPSPSRKRSGKNKPGSSSDRARTKAPPAPAGTLLQNLATAAAIYFSVLLVYWPALRGALIWDDDRHLTRPALQSLQGLWRIWFDLRATQQYYPLLHSAFWIEHQLWGNAVLGYHLANVTEHALSAFLVVLIVRRLQLRGALLAGFIFALHPVCVEAVAWISEQKSTLSGVFYLAAALTYLYFDRSRRKYQYLLAFGLFAMALLSKTVTATLPAALLVVFWWQRGRIEWRRDVMPLVPWFAVGAGYGLFTAWVERNLIGAKGPEFDLSAIQHFLLTGRLLCFYAGKVLWPVDLIFSYPRWHLAPAVWWQYLYPLAVLLVLGALVVLARGTRASVQRGPLAGFLYFGGTLFPVLGFLHVYPFRYSYVADHFQYLAMLGIIVPVAWVLSQSAAGIPKTARVAAAVLLLTVLGVLTWRQASLYRDVEVLYRTTLVRNPQSWMTHNNLGIYLIEDKGRLHDAMLEFQAVLLIKPDHAKAHMNLGNIYSQMPGRTLDAIAEYQKSLELDPAYVPTYLNLGMLLVQTPGGAPEAVEVLRAALKRSPNEVTAHALLGAALAQIPGGLPDAIKEYQAVLWSRPGDVDTHLKLADALAQFPERRQDAIAQYQIVLQLRPDSKEARQGLARLQALDSTGGQAPTH